MRINQNIAAFNAYRNLNTTQNHLGKSLEKLSSGFRINRAADDAAGLVKSENLRAEIRGTDQAVANAQDGISMVQTAEGALNEVHAILQRMRELAVSAANETSSGEAEQAEVAQLRAELGEIANRTQFAGIKLLDGSLAASQTPVETDAITPVESTQTGTAGSPATSAQVTFTPDDATALNFDTGNGGTALTFDIAVDGGSVQNISISNADYSNNLDGLASALSVAITGATVTEVGGNLVFTSDDSGASSRIVITNVTNGANAGIVAADESGDAEVPAAREQLTLDFASEVPETDTGTLSFVFEVDGATVTVDVPDSVDVSDAGAVATAVQGAFSATGFEATVAGTAVTIQTDTDRAADISLVSATHTYDGTPTPDNSAVFQVGANAGDTLSVGFASVATDSTGLDIDGIDVSTAAGATSALTALDTAIAQVSRQRADLGAIQNRLEHTIANLQVASENLAASESRIRDTDMAAEMVNFTRSQILQQAGTAMLAQANQVPQSVLALLR